MTLQENKPPRLALKLFRWYCNPDRLEELEGDLEEFYYLRLSEGVPAWKANAFFWWNVVRCYRSYAKSKTQNKMTFYPLFKSYFKLALRHSWKNKWSVMINIMGLGIALSMCVFVYTIYAYNFEFDSFFEDTDDIYRIHSMSFENGQERRNELSPSPLDEALRNEFGSIRQVSSFFDEWVTIKKGTDYFNQSAGVVSSDFFEMFPMPLWYGSYQDFGTQPMVYLTRDLAKKYFGNQAALGEQLTIYPSSNQKVEVVVGGVFDHIPLNTSFDVDLIMSQQDYLTATGIPPNDWSSRLYLSHFVRTNPEQIEAIATRLDESLSLQNDAHPELKMTGFDLVPFRSPLIHDDHLYRANTNYRLTQTVYIVFTTLALMVFLIACFNLANTSMAMIANRLKEIGIRKTLGSENRQILIQFLLEMGVVCVFSFVLALSMINFTSNSIMGLFGASFLIKDANLTGVILFIAAFLLTTTLIAGLMPALYAWKFSPIAIMRKSVRLKGVTWLNKTLTIAQYAFSIAVLSSAITFSKNSDFLEGLDPGYANDRIYMIDMEEGDEYAQIKQRIDQIPGIISAGANNHIQMFGRTSSRSLLQIDTSSYELRSYQMSPEYLELMQIPIANGRTFHSREEQSKILINQEFATRYFAGEDPTNQTVKIDEERKTIVGVVANIIDDVYEDAEEVPTVFITSDSETFRFLVAKVTLGDKDEVEAQFRSIWSDLIDRPYNGGWQKDLAYGSAVRDSDNLKIIFLAMAVLGGFLSIVGIFSLAKLNVAKRLKEISIRKVLGSSFKELIVTINRSFLLILTLSVAVGAGLGYFIAEMVLSMIYKYYVDVSLSTSLLSGLFIVAISIMMIVATMSPATRKPIAGLREE